MAGMGAGASKDGRGTWVFLVAGAVIGLTVGILVSVTTDLPLAPEAGLVIGLLAGWLGRRLNA
jgi:ABC-type dipeptide/oligopeptide/nickel transport system permease subunit